MKAQKKLIKDILGIHARNIKFSPKTNPSNGYLLSGFIPRIALMDLMNNFHIYITKQGNVAVVSPGRLSVSQKDI